MSEQRHSYSQRFESTSATCTVKLFECQCGDWRLCHYGCHGNWDSADLEAENARLQERVKGAECGAKMLRQELDAAVKREKTGRREALRRASLMLRAAGNDAHLRGAGDDASAFRKSAADCDAAIDATPAAGERR